MIERLLEAERALSFGRLDQAERLYRSALEADPRNAIAVVGLARVALDRGDDRLAYALGLRALEIDPENAAAARLVARLDEVLRHRGEEPPTAPADLPWEARGGRGEAAVPTGARGGRPAGASPSHRPGLLARLRGRIGR